MVSSRDRALASEPAVGSSPSTEHWGFGKLRVRHRRFLGTVGAAAVSSLLAVGLSTTGAAAQSSEPGVSAKSVKLGYIFSESGVAGSTFKNAGKACQARVDSQNAKGGVNGRKIDLEIIDDASSGANLTAAQDLVQNRDVFAVVNNSSFAFLSYRYLLDQGVPMIGGGYDGTYYGQKGNEDIVGALGNTAPFNGLSYDTTAKVMKQLGARKVAAVAYGSSPSSTASAKTLQDYADPAQGLKAVYTNTAIDFGSTDVGPVVLGIKNSGADAVYLPLVAGSNFAIVQGLAQNGVQMKANILATGYGQDMLDSPIAKTVGPNTVVFQTYKPVEVQDTDTKAFQADLKKYAKLTGVPDYGVYLGYLTCDLAITGLEQAGQNPTRQGFVDGLHKLRTWDAAGLSCAPIDISLETFGKYPETGCAYYMYVKDGQFVVMNHGKPFTGKLVGSKAALKANQTGDTSAVVTTTAAPAP
jgi:branched-chain amino acid transport system substrate-binding protein